ncbi:MAG: hypothetical protein DME04_26625 [Candidatus Rokuibacteriota bacterium]|nr:MAG: hypothetical protein DME04_26625 [Candidatus Rokubacteria bacterium]
MAVSDGQLSTPTSFQLTVTATNTAPTITPIADQTINEDTATGALAFTVGDAETAPGSLTVSGSSSNPTLVPNGNIVFGGTGANRTVTVTPAANQNGTATITVTVSDGQLSTPTSFQLTVTAVNDAPTITSIANQTTTVGTAVGPLSFTVGDVETAAGSLTVSGSSSNPGLVPNANIVFGGSGANRTVTVTPAAGQTGTATITVAVSDGQLSTPTSFQLTVTATPAGLVAAYGFSEGAGPTVADGSGNNNTGTLGSGVTWTAAGRYGSALVFNGAGYVTVPNATSLQLTNGMTLSAWIYPTAVPTNWATTVMKEQPNEFVYVLYAGSPANRPNVYINQGPGTSTEHGFAGPSALPLSAWSHLASTYDGTTLRLYVNGVQVGSQAVGGPIATSTGALRIGGNGVWNEYFQGRIDELRVYNRALSAAEITTDMNSAVGGGGGGDTTPPAVAVTSPAGGSTVFNFVSVAATASDNVAVAGVSFFVDGSPIAAEVTSAPYSVVWDSTTSSPGSHTVTAVARDFAGNTTTSAPVSVTVVATSPSNIGQFGPVTAWPFVAVNAVLLRTGEVLAWDGQTFGGKDARIWNPSTNVFTPVPISQTNLFCTGQCALADGRILVAGGHVDAAHVGVTDTNIFDPAARTWTKVASMTYPRWYPTTTTLPDGRVLVVAGEMNCDKCDALIPEIYNPQTNTWIQLTSASLLFPYYPHMFVLPNGRVLVASTAEDPIVSRVLDLQSQTWTVVDPAAVDGGSAVMYLPGKVLKAGTSTDPDMPTVPSAATAYIIDMTQPSPLWQAITPMTFQRTYGTLTLLPDGSALMVGGGVTTNAIDASGAIAPLELWSPLTQKWTTMAGLGAPRLYHSTALLLPDGRVLIAGGGRFFGSPDQTDQLSAEIYSPPYLFKGARPTITSAPTTATYGGTFTVQTPDAARVTAINLVKLGAVTHAFNMDQRFLPLSFSPVSGGFTVQAPANGNLAPPGYYMLFLIDTNGVPSVAAMLKLQ